MQIDLLFIMDDAGRNFSIAKKNSRFHDMPEIWTKKRKFLLLVDSVHWRLKITIKCKTLYISQF